MPLRAIINQQEVISSLLSDEEWDELKREVKSNGLEVIIAQTKRPGYLRKSKLGLNHFVYQRGQKPDNWKPESPEHLWIKNEIILGCRDAGWKATPEFMEDNWIADVLAEQDDKRIAFEVQWSSQTGERTLERQEEYLKSKVRGCWFFKTPPKEYREPFSEEIKALKGLPMFRVIKNEAYEIVVLFNENEYSIRSFVCTLLQGKIKFRRNLTAKPVQTIEVTFYKHSCWKCGKLQDLYFLPGTVESKCGHDLYLSNTMWDGGDLAKDPEIVEEVKNLVDPKSNKPYQIGEVKPRFSRTVEKVYPSFGCYYCDAIFGDFFLSRERLEASNDPNNTKHNLSINLKGVYDKDHDEFADAEAGHWCYNEEKSFC